MNSTVSRQPVILLVEDNPDDEMLARRAFRAESRDHCMTVARDGNDAIHCATTEKPPALVLLDLNLPGADGFAVLEAIRRHPPAATTPVVVLTSSADAKDITRAYALGANSYITKPVDYEEFMQVVHRLSEYWLDLNRDGEERADGTQ
jgi:two-component system, response regulator